MNTFNFTPALRAKTTKMIANLSTKLAALPKKWLATGAVIGAGGLAALTFSFAYPANTPPGVADLLAVVTQTVAPNEAGSTASFKTADQIQYTGTFKAPDIKVPQWESHLTEFGAGQLYVNGSSKTPPGYRASYLIGNNWQNNEPASGALVTKIKYTYAPLQYTAGAAGFPGFGAGAGGDGYQITSFEGRVYLVNHHTTGNFIKCFESNGTTTTTCAGWTGGKTGGADIHTPHVSIAEVNRNKTSPGYGNLYYPATKKTGLDTYVTGFGCFNLIIAVPCTVNFIEYDDPKSISAANTFWTEKVQGLGTVGSKIYAVNGTGKIYCLDMTTGQKCPTTNGENYQLPTTPSFSPAFLMSAGGGVHDNNAKHLKQLPGYNEANPSYIFLHSYYSTVFGETGASGGPVYCFNATTNQPCSGTWPVLVTTANSSAKSYAERITTNTDGSFKSVCMISSGSNASCVDATGAAMPFPVGLTKQLSHWAAYVRETGYTTKPTATYPLASRRMYSLSGLGEVLCYDEDTAAACAGFSMTKTSSGGAYSIVSDPERHNCLWTDSDGGDVHSFDANTGGACNTDGGKLELSVKPMDAYQCDPASANITGWDAIVTSGAPTADLKVKIINGVTNAQLGPELSFPAGQQHLDISAIPFTSNTHLIVQIRNTGTAVVDGFVADVTWKGGPKQFCSKITAGSDCEASAKFTASSTDAPSSNYTALPAVNKLLIKDLVRQGYGAGSAVSNTEIKNNPLVFRGTFDEATLSGDMSVARYEYDPTTLPPKLGPGAIIKSASSAGVTPAPSNRNVITQLPTTPAAPNAIATSVAFNWNSLDASQRDLLSKPAPGATSLALDAAIGQKRVDYIRGVASDEISNGGKLRNRTGTARTMGMVLGSSLVYLPSYGNMGYSNAAQPGYAAFALSTGRTKPTVFVNANDGMLHAYTVVDQGGSNVTLAEQFAYLPNRLISKMSEYTDKSKVSLAQSPYFNDNSPMVADINLGSDWATVLASAFGRGAKGLYMLNVTKADSVTQSDPQNLAIREFTDANDADMGYIVSQPVLNELNFTTQIVQVKSGTTLRPAVIVGNGINSTNGNAALFIIYLDTTGGYLKITMPATAITGVANGLSTPRVLTSKVDGVADRVYAGDLHGNMWGIDISDLSTTPTPYKLFNTGLDAAGRPIPIATAPTAMRFNPSSSACANCWMVNFATGKPTTGVLLFDKDIPKQTAYGIWDKGASATVPASKLVAQTIDTTTTNVYGGAVTIRKVDYALADVLGWYMHLPATQMTVANPLLRSDGTFRIFTIKQTFQSSGICYAAGGDVYDVNAYNGNTSPRTLDINGDLRIDSADLVTVTDTNGDTVQVAAATKNVGEAQRGAAQIIDLGTGTGTNLEVAALASGNKVVTGIKNPGNNSTDPKRIAWREIVK